MRKPNRGKHKLDQSKQKKNRSVPLPRMIRPRRCDHRHLETEDALTVVVEMPGVEKGNVDISVKDRTLTLDGRLDFEKYAGMQPVYTEYNIGNFHRRFSLSNKVDATNIRAEMRDGLLILTIPKAEEAKA